MVQFTAGIKRLLLLGVLGVPVTAALLNAQTYSVIRNFNGPDGANPESTLIADAAGNLYGTTAYGGATYVGGL